MAKARSQYRCSECHHVTAKWVGRCPDCGTWGTVDEVAVLAAVNGSATSRAVAPTTPAVPISSIDPGRHQALSHRRQRARPRARRRHRARLGDAACRRSRRRQVDAAARGRPPMGRHRAAGAVSVGRGVRGPDPDAGRAHGLQPRRRLPGRRVRSADRARPYRGGPSRRWSWSTRCRPCRRPRPTA